MKLSEIAWPVYKVGLHPPTIEDGVVFYFTIKREDDKSITPSVKIIDDRNITGDKLSLRRLRISGTGAKLHKLQHAIFFPGDLLKLATPKMWFIDSLGKLFNYKKSKIVPLIFKKILITHRTPSASLVEIQDIPGRYMCLYPPNTEEKYAGVLKVDKHSYILYGFFKELHKDTVRKI